MTKYFEKYSEQIFLNALHDEDVIFLTRLFHVEVKLMKESVVKEG